MHLNLTLKRDKKLNILLFKNTNIILLSLFNEITNEKVTLIMRQHD